MTKEIQQEKIRGIALRAKALGGRAMLVGGCVRDALTGRQSADIDCEVYGLAPQALRSLAAEFGEVDESGARYGIFSLKGAGIDLAVPRLERRIGPKHGDFDVRLDPALPFARAAARRDFTVNAILQDALTGEIVDPFGGQADLRRGVLRAVPGDGFAEDPLRVLRGAQFAARFRLSPDAKTLEKMRMMKTDALSPARGEDGEWHACGHENTGVPLTRAMLGRLGVNREIIAYCENMCRLHMRAHVCHYRQAETGETNLLFDESVCPNDLALLAVCDTLGKGSASGGAR